MLFSFFLILLRNSCVELIPFPEYVFGFPVPSCKWFLVGFPPLQPAGSFFPQDADTSPISDGDRYEGPTLSSRRLLTFMKIVPFRKNGWPPPGWAFFFLPEQVITFFVPFFRFFARMKEVGPLV